jgi:hypothetical protein
MSYDVVRRRITPRLRRRSLRSLNAPLEELSFVADNSNQRQTKFA